MNLLLDTHTLLWWAFDAPELSSRARALLADRANCIYVSPASAWEIATKHRLGRLPEVAVLAQDMPGWFAHAGMMELPITTATPSEPGRFQPLTAIRSTGCSQPRAWSKRCQSSGTMKPC